MDPFSNPLRLIHGDGPFRAAETLREVAAEIEKPYALTLDVAAWHLTHYQTPASAWAYVRPLEEWAAHLRGRGISLAAPGERADLVLLRAPDDALEGTQEVEGHVLVGTRRLVEDCARLGGRHGLDAARVYVEYVNARGAGVRLDADAMLKVCEEMAPWT